MLIQFVVLSALSLAHAEAPLAEGDFLAQTRPIVAGKQKRFLFCDGQAAAAERTGQVCCELEINSQWNVERTLNVGDRRIRSVVSESDYGYLDIEADANAWNSTRFNQYFLQVRCSHHAPTPDIIRRSFGSLFVPFRSPARSTSIRPVDTQRRASANFDFRENEVATLSPKTVAFVTHAAEEFDGPGISAPGVQRLLSLTRAAGIPSFGVITSADKLTNQFYKPADVNYLAESDGGQSHLTFPNLRSVIVGGGHLTMCLCETIRDVVREPVHTGRTINVFLVADAIYNAPRFLAPLVRAGRTWQYRYNLPGGDRAILLEDLVQATSDEPDVLIEQLKLELIKVTITMGTDYPMSFCGQNESNSPELDREAMVYDIYRGETLLASIEGGSHPSRHLRLILTNTSRLRADLARWGEAGL